jgi:predicted nucleic acid-binding protein
MPEVIVNTSPLQYLFQTGALELLPFLYNRIIVPAAVVLELKRGRELGCSLPTVTELPWATVKEPQHPMLLPLAGGLGLGESAVLVLPITNNVRNSLNFFLIYQTNQSVTNFLTRTTEPRK